MRLRSFKNSLELREKFYDNWTRWYAWFPVRINTDNGRCWVWFESVERKLRWHNTSFLIYISWLPDSDLDHRWEYREIEKGDKVI